MKRRTKTVLTAVLILAVAALLAGPQLLKGTAVPVQAAPGVAGPGGPGAPGAPPAVATVYSVKTQALATGVLRDYLQLNGDVITETNVDLFPDTGGKVTTVPVQVGDSVVKGTTLIATIDPSKPGTSYALSPVYSPLTGTVTTLTAQVGATVTSTTSLGTVGVLSDLLVESKVPETQLASVRTGLKADVTFETYPGKVFPAVVDRVLPVVDTVSRTKTIRLRFLNKPAGIDLGMFAKVKLYFEGRPPQILAPLETVVTRLGKQYVFVVNGDTVSRREVVAGLTVDSTVELLSGVKAGEALVVKGQELLDDGAKVKVVQ
jgi:multidrug efflux pump subunit AcrA (membrane-fusion protein)